MPDTINKSKTVATRPAGQDYDGSRSPEEIGNILTHVFDEPVRLPNALPPMRLTENGVWLPTSVAAMRSMLQVFHRAETWESQSRPVTVFDAGAGDGRLLAYLALIRDSLGRTADDIRLLGMECDPELVRVAFEKKQSLAITELPVYDDLVEGDYLEPLAYDKLSISLDQIDIFVNYPDGNERALATLIARRARPGTRLYLTTAEATLRVSSLPLIRTYRCVLSETESVRWHVYMHEKPE